MKGAYLWVYRDIRIELLLFTLTNYISMSCRDDEICRLKQGHGNTMMQVENGRDEMTRKDNEINELKVSFVLLLRDVYICFATLAQF